MGPGKFLDQVLYQKISLTGASQFTHNVHMAIRKIIHVDMDCFYAAVEVKHNPDLRGKPIGIGGPPNTRSVLCTASYEARKYKVRAAMPSSQALRLCPQLILIPPHFDLNPIEKTSSRLKLLSKLIKRKDVDTLINA